MAPSRKNYISTYFFFFLGDCPIFFFFAHTAGWFLFTGSSERKKHLPFFYFFFSCRVRRWTMRSSGFGCCTTKTLSPSRGGCSREGSTWPSLMTVTPQPSTRPWLESHTVSKGASLCCTSSQNLPEFMGRVVCALNLPPQLHSAQWEKFLLWAHSFLWCKMLCTRTQSCYF